MGFRFRWLLVILGALLVIATYTYPLWRPEPQLNPDRPGYPGLAEELQAKFVDLPIETQRIYLMLRDQNEMRALELVTAHLSPPEPLPAEEQEPPPLENAVDVASGEFGPIEMTDDEMAELDESEIPAMFAVYNQLYRDSTGNVIIYQYPDNSRLLRIEGLNIINGPDLHVALSPNAMPLSGEIRDLGNIFIDIGPLKSNTGDQNYPTIPNAADLNLSNYQSVVIYDQTHRIVFAVAPLD